MVDNNTMLPCDADSVTRLSYLAQIESFSNSIQTTIVFPKVILHLGDLWLTDRKIRQFGLKFIINKPFSHVKNETFISHFDRLKIV